MQQHKERTGRWPKSLDELADQTLTQYQGSRFYYDPTRLWLALPLQYYDRSFLHLMTHGRFGSRGLDEEMLTIRIGSKRLRYGVELTKDQFVSEICETDRIVLSNALPSRTADSQFVVIYAKHDAISRIVEGIRSAEPIPPHIKRRCICGLRPIGLALAYYDFKPSCPIEGAIWRGDGVILEFYQGEKFLADLSLWDDTMSSDDFSFYLHDIRFRVRREDLYSENDPLLKSTQRVYTQRFDER